MIIDPGISTLLNCIGEEGCRYTLVTIAAKRARMIGKARTEGRDISEFASCDSDKAVSIAAHEIASGKIRYKLPKVKEEEAIKENLEEKAQEE